MECKFCNKKLSTSFNLRRHMKSLHNSTRDNFIDGKCLDDKSIDESLTRDENSNDNQIKDDNSSSDSDESLRKWQKELLKRECGEELKPLSNKEVKEKVFGIWMYLIKFSNVKEKIGEINDVEDIWKNHNILMRVADSLADGLKKYQNNLWSLRKYSTLYSAIEDEAERLSQLKTYYDCEIYYVAWRNRAHLLRKLLQKMDNYSNELQNYLGFVDEQNDDSDESYNANENVEENKSQWLHVY